MGRHAIVHRIPLPARSRQRSERGQALVLFVLAFTALLAMAALLFDGAQSLVLRRHLQAAADAGAMAGANTFPANSLDGCSAGGTSPRDVVRLTAMTAIQANLGTLVTDGIELTCVGGFGPPALRVMIHATTPAYFISLVRPEGLRVSATGTAMNGQVSAGKFSIIALNPGDPSWRVNGGCPSILFSGGPSVIFEGSIQANSRCQAGDGGALGTNGNAASLVFRNGADARLVGGFVQGPLQVDPPPKTGQPVVPDPLQALPDMPVSSLVVRSSRRLVLNNQQRVLEPGIYVGGIQLRNTSQAYLRPGIYVMDGGGLDMGSQTSLFSIDALRSSTTVTRWASDCGSACGVLIYNTGTVGTMDPITIGAGATALLKPYRPGIHAYANLLIWQSGTPATTNNYTQPPITLNGGGTLDVSGTLYAPSAKVFLTGGAGGTSGGDLDVTLQFVVYDVQIQGNTRFHFRYGSDAFAKPFEYGLVQ